MNKRKIEKLIPIAIECIEKTNLIIVKENKIPKEFNGYISNFGASITQSGLMATVAFFETTDNKSNQNRGNLTKLILNVINKEKDKNFELDEKIKLLGYIIENKSKKNIVKEEVINAAIAVKLAMRVFEFTDEMDSKEVDS